ncbi:MULTISPECIES: sulfotransferase family 2 domain-containing protein [Burkholderia]|nr:MULTISPECIES: sulfotransferase family 2 domain-containing protein [Burkholderia]
MTMMYFNDHKLRFIRIPKNACSTVINTLGFSRIQGRNPHHVGEPFADAPADAVDWPCLVVLRDPFERVVSAYLNKFTEILPDELFVHELVEYVWRAQRGKPRPSSTSSITFREFITHLCAFPDEQLDPHWRSQSAFLTEKPTIFLRMEALRDQWISHPLLREIELKTYAPHATKSDLNVGINVLDVSGEAFLGFKEICGQFPASSQFRDLDLVERVRTRFAQDYALIDSVFGSSEK